MAVITSINITCSGQMYKVRLEPLRFYKMETTWKLGKEEVEWKRTDRVPLTVRETARNFERYYRRQG